MLDHDIRFNTAGTELMRLCPNGEVYVHGRLVTTDEEITDGLREWLKVMNKESIAIENVKRENVRLRDALVKVRTLAHDHDFAITGTFVSCPACIAARALAGAKTGEG